MGGGRGRVERLDPTPEESTAVPAREFEHLLARLSRRLSSASTDKLNDAIVAGLRELALHFGVQRAFLGRLRNGLVYADHVWMHSDLSEEQTEFYRVFDPADFPIVGRSVAGETVAIRSREEIPESSAERRYMDHTGLVSTLFVPGTVAEEVAGLLVMDSFAEAKAWPDALVHRVALPVDLLFGALLRLEAAARIDELADFERLVAELSGALASATVDELEPSIDACLEKLAVSLGAERAFMACFDDSGDRLVFTNTWAIRGLSPSSEIFDLDLVGELPWVAEQIRRGGIIRAGSGNS